MSAPQINFSQIIASLRTNGAFAEFSNTLALQGLSAVPKQALIIGQMLSGASVTGAPLTLYQITNGPQADQLFGRGSMLARMCKAFIAANPNTSLWAIGLADPTGGTAATATLTVTGPATSNGTLSLYIGGDLVQVAVTNGDSATVIATNIAAAVNALTDLPCTAASALGVVTLTCRFKGTLGNVIDIRENYQTGELAQEPAGVAIAVVGFAGGTLTPTLSSVIAVLPDVQYNIIAQPFTDATNLTALETELARRWNGMVQCEGMAFTAINGTLSAMETLGTSRNSPFNCIMESGLSPTPPWIWAAVVAAVDAAEPIPSRPRQTLPLPGLLAPALTDQLDRAERDLLLHDGIATFVVDSGGNVLIERLVTSYQTNTQGVADASYLDVTTLETLSALRYTFRAFVSNNWPRCMLADDTATFAPGQPIVTPKSIKAGLLNLFSQWQDASFVYNIAVFKAGLIVQRNASDPNRVDIVMTPALMNQFIVAAAQIQFLLGIFQ